MKQGTAWIAAAALTLGTSPLLAQSAQSISASDKATGAQAHPQLVREFGGALRGPQAAYVEKVGRKIAVQSGLSNSEKDFTITLLDSPVNNAFAIPGGYVYVTRGLLALMNDEAELASVLGHEVGHVAARHSAKRQQTATISSVLAAVVGAAAGNSGIGSLVGKGASIGADLVTRGFSRTQEYQADDLGVRYLAQAGYDPLAAANMLSALGSQEALEARSAGKSNNVPTWLSTHPNSADRVKRAQGKARETGAIARSVRNRDAFLNAINGMVYGENPAGGFMDGQVFKLPNERLAFTVPQGFTLQNSDDAVTIVGTGGKAVFSGGTISGGLSSHIDRVFNGLTQGGVQHSEIRTTKVNGIDTAYASGQVNASSGPVDVAVFAYQGNMATQAYHFITIAPAGSGLGPFQSLVQSVTRISDVEAGKAKSKKVSVVTIKAGETLASLSARMAYPDYKLERFLVLNSLTSSSVLKPGMRVKLIVQ